MLILFEIGLRINGFIILSLQEHKNRLSLKQKGTYRIICLGESTTQNQYPRFLGNILNQRNIGIKFSVIDKGLSGTNTTAILLTLEENLNKYKPDMVVTMMGSNDSGIKFYENIPHSDSALFKNIRIYRLLKMIWRDIITKTQKIGFYKPRTKQLFSKLRPSFLSIGLKEGFAEEEKPVLNYPEYVKLGLLYREQHKYKEAEEAIKKAIELNSENDSAYVELGMVYKDQARLAEAEASFQKVIELNPKNNLGYEVLGLIYTNQSRFTEAENTIKQAIALAPKNGQTYLSLGLLYKDCGRYIEAEQSIKQAIALAPKSDRAYVSLGLLYKDCGRYAEAEAFLKKAIELNPKNDFAYQGLGWLYRSQQLSDKSEETIKKAIDLNPKNDSAYLELGLYYKDYNRFAEAEDAFKKAINFNPNNNSAYLELGKIYRYQNRLTEAEAFLKKAIELNPKNNHNNQANGVLEILYSEMRNNKLSKENMKKTKELRKEFYKIITASNYLKLKQILDKRNVRLVCVQYPMCDLEPLKRIFNDQKRIIFVDNERPFRDAVRKFGYNTYFNDMFGGNFGHCTDKGNQLLATNIAKAILKEVFFR